MKRGTIELELAQRGQPNARIKSNGCQGARERDQCWIWAVNVIGNMAAQRADELSKRAVLKVVVLAIDVLYKRYYHANT